jgi:hypothetical protein
MIKFLEGVEDDKDGADDVELDDGVPGRNQERWQVSHGSWKPVAPHSPCFEAPATAEGRNQERWQVSHGSWKPVTPHSPCFEAPATAVASPTIWQTGERWQWVGLQGEVGVLAGEGGVV